MSIRTKLLCYLIAIAGVVGFGSLFYKKFTTLTKEAREPNQPSQTNPSPAIAEGTVDTNAASTNVAAPPPSLSGAGTKPTGARKDYSQLFVNGGLCVGFVIGLGFLLAHDLSGFIGDRTTKLLFNDEGEGVANPEYEQAEQVWADGQPLDAIRLMRDYLNKNPREQYVALRIAEIYEKDLGNYLAAALEYEEVLKQKLTPDRWGWAAIHLCNLYSSKLNQPEKAVDLLRKIDADCGETAPAVKARKRLAAYDSAGEAALNEEPRG